MDSLQSEEGQHFVRSLAQFIRHHEKALANSLQLSVHRRHNSTNASSASLSSLRPGATSSTNNSSTLATALSFAGLSFRSHAIKSALLTLTPHHLYYLLSRIEELGIAVGSLSIRLENVISDSSPTNYVSFLQERRGTRSGRSDKDSIHSVSSVRSTLSSMTTFWASIGLGGSASSKSEKAKAAAESDLKYLYSAFTKLPSLRLTTDHRARLIRGYEEFPFDTAVPLFAFKNLQQLDIINLDFRQFCGWDRLAEQLVLLTVKRANVEDPAELLTDIVLDDAEKRRRRSAKGGRQGSPTLTSSWTVPSTPRPEFDRSHSDLGSPSDDLDLGASSRTPTVGSPSKPQRYHHHHHHHHHHRSHGYRSRYPPQEMSSVSSSSINISNSNSNSNSNNRPRLNSQPALSDYRKHSSLADATDLSSISRPRSYGDVLSLGGDGRPAGQEYDPSSSPKATAAATGAAGSSHDGGEILAAGSVSPRRHKANRPSSAYRHVRPYSSYAGYNQRSGSGSSDSIDTFRRSDSASNLLEFSGSGSGNNILPASKWQRLKYLSLADNGMAYIPARSLAPVASSLRSLNLASNLFVEVPDALASLTRLVSVDLSNCMIESLQSLTRSPLPAITTLKLRGNRLKSLAGVERLLSLENLDVQDNRLTDPTEAARLTGLPNLRRVWMKQNPLTKSYSNWRLTVFNLFRQTPGYVDDIIIDDSGPGFAERKQLVERVAEVEPRFANTVVQIADPPVVRVGAEHPKQALATAVAKTADTGGEQEQQGEPTELSKTASMRRRRKSTRRRIVDLAQDDSSTRRSLSDVPAVVRMSFDSSQLGRDRPDTEYRKETRVQAAENKTRTTSVDQDTPDLFKAATLPVSMTDEGPEDYKAKIEALRRDFGSNWLNQLGDQGWHNDHHLEIQRGEAIAHGPLHAAASPVIVSGARTLG